MSIEELAKPSGTGEYTAPISLPSACQNLSQLLLEINNNHVCFLNPGQALMSCCTEIIL